MPVLDRTGGFPFAPEQWDLAEARELARQEGLELTDDHWEELRALQEFCARHDCSRSYSVRELHDALDEKFHDKGGYRYLYKLFPGGPIAQGCRLAGLEPPAGAVDKGFGSVV
ncbi:MAG TPA: TusE/DsrC/DsvC family sulfur relay protein [Gammaproteobacteria bacterium]|nr:TusE/DsrC/DsvC family sulfur relay protein [Gammaproteobacteria bacterium]